MSAPVERLSFTDLWSIVAKIEYRPGYELQVNRYFEHHGGDQRDRYTIQVRKFRKDVDTGVHGWGYGGEYMLPVYVTPSAVVSKCMRAFIDYEEHEAREDFRVGGVAVLGPHPNLIGEMP